MKAYGVTWVTRLAITNVVRDHRTGGGPTPLGLRVLGTITEDGVAKQLYAAFISEYKALRALSALKKRKQRKREALGYKVASPRYAGNHC